MPLHFSSNENSGKTLHGDIPVSVSLCNNKPAKHIWYSTLVKSAALHCLTVENKVTNVICINCAIRQLEFPAQDQHPPLMSWCISNIKLLFVKMVVISCDQCQVWQSKIKSQIQIRLQFASILSVYCLLSIPNPILIFSQLRRVGALRLWRSCHVRVIFMAGYLIRSIDLMVV